MRIGVPRERKADERRVAITPDGVQLLHSLGHTVMVETSAGALSGFPDAEFENAGAKIVPTLKELWDESELIVKVKEPAPEEEEYFRPGLAVFSFLHLAVAPELTKKMVETGVTGLDYDLVMLDDGRLPVLEPMSVIAGRLSIQCGAYGLQANCGGRGILLGGSTGVRPARVVVIGAGAAGSNAARVAAGMGARVTLLDINTYKLAPFFDEGDGIATLYSTPEAILRSISRADMIIGSVLVPGALAPKLVTREMLKEIPDGAVIVDICIDQGGFAESSKPTTISDPFYTEDRVIHYCVTNMPALVPRTSTEALTNATLGWVRMLAENGIEKTLRNSAPMRRSLTSYKGHLTNTAIGEAVRIQETPDTEVDAMLREA